MDDSLSTITCTHCGAEQSENFKFCSNCGKRNVAIVKQEKKRNKEYDSNLIFLSVYTLFTIITILIFSISGESFTILVSLTILFAIVDLLFGILQPSVWKLLRFRNFKIGPALAIFGIAIFSGIVVSYLMVNLNMIIFEETYEIMPVFYHLDYPLLVGIIMVSIFPALFEEFAFRGFVYNNLKVLSGEKAAIWGSTFLFAIVHFSLVSLIWIIPFGLLLAYFRKTYSTILYGIIGHFIHNTTTLLIEHYNLF